MYSLFASIVSSSGSDYTGALCIVYVVYVLSCSHNEIVRFCKASVIYLHLYSIYTNESYHVHFASQFNFHVFFFFFF